MANFFAWLLAAAVPIVKKVLFALGIGTITYTGTEALMSAVISTMTGYFSQLGIEMAGFIALSGMFTAAGITLGAITARAAFVLANRFGMLL